MIKYCLLVAFLTMNTPLGVCATRAEKNTAFALPSGVNVEIHEATFSRDLMNVSSCGDSNRHCLINGHIPFGTDAATPKTFVKEIKISYQGRSYLLDASDMYNAWGDRPLEVKGAVRYFGGGCFDAENCEFRGLFADGAGTFVAEWHIVNGIAVRTVLTNSNDVVNLFLHHIDPPEYE